MYREFYRRKADEMSTQAARAETAFLRHMYQSIADQWTRMADAGGAPTLRMRETTETSH